MKAKVLTWVCAFGMIATPLFAQDPTGEYRLKKQPEHSELMPIHAKLLQMQKTQDAEIEKLLAEMNAATGEKKIDAIAAVIGKLVEQRKAMNAEIASHLDR